MTAIRRLVFQRRQLDEILQKSLLHLWRNLVELIKIDDHKLRHRLINLTLFRQNQIVTISPLQFWRQQSATESTLVVSLLGNQKRSHRVAILAMGKAAPLVNHAQKPGVEPVCPVRIVGRNRTGQGTYMVLPVPFVVALEEIFIYRIIILDIIRLQKIPDILDAHSDISELHLQRHALLHSRIYGLETIPTLLLRHVFHEFHHRVVSEVIFTFQQLHHAHDILANAVLVNFLFFFRSIGTRNRLLNIIHIWSWALRTYITVNLHRHRLTVEIRFRIERHHKTVVHRRLKR